MSQHLRTLLLVLLALVIAGEGQTLAQEPAPERGVATEAGFTIGPEDVLGILVWREADVSGDVTVRADGMITLPLIRDVQAAGLTTDELAERIQTSLREYITDASVTVILRQMNSRKVFITGEVGKPGAYPLASPTTVIQLIAVAGGVTEFADANQITRASRGGRREPHLPDPLQGHREGQEDRPEHRPQVRRHRGRAREVM